MWEHSFVLADALSRHRNPWSATKLGALRPEGASWDYKQALVVVLGAEIGLVTSVLGLMGSAVLTLDSSMRLLAAAKSNVAGNLGTDGIRRVALRKILWGSPVSLGGVTGGSKTSADMVVISHATCEGAFDNAVMQSAASVMSDETLLLVAHGSTSTCDALQGLRTSHEMAKVPTHSLDGSLGKDVTLTALKRKPRPEKDEE